MLIVYFTCRYAGCMEYVDFVIDKIRLHLPYIYKLF
jgi:hypothetical protein